MAVVTSAQTDLEIQASDGTWLPVMLQVETDDHEHVQPKSLQETLAAAENDQPISDVLQADVRESWFGGVGLAYDWAPGVDCLDPEYASPAGAATDVTLPGGADGTIVAIEEYNGNLYMAQEGLGPGPGRVISIASGTGAPAASLTLAAGEYMRGLVAAQDVNGNARLYAFSSDGGVQNGRVHEFDGATWTSTAAATFGTNGRSRAVIVDWRGRDGIRGMRIVCISGPRTIAYTKPNSNPLLAASWVEGVKIGTATTLVDVTAARGHVFFSARDGLFDLDEVGNSDNLAGFAAQSVTTINSGQCVQYSDGSVFWSWSAGLTKINAEQAGVLQEQPGFCSPGAFLPVEGCPRGDVVAMCVDQGWVAAAVFDAQRRWSAVFYGKSREQLGFQSPNPMIWHGPLLLMTNDYRVTRMRATSLSGGLRLWVASVLDSTGAARLSWLSRPYAGTTRQDQLTGGMHRVTTGSAGGTLQPYSRLYMLPTTHGDKASREDLHQVVVGSRGLSVSDGSTLTFYARIDPDPATDTWPSGTTVSAGPIATITPTGTTQGYTLQYRVDFTATSGGATPPKIPYLDSLRVTTWKISPSTNVRSLVVQYGDGVLNLHNGHDDTLSPDQITNLLLATLGQRTVIRDRLDNRRNVRLRQFFQADVTLGEANPFGKLVTATLRYDDLGAA